MMPAKTLVVCLLLGTVGATAVLAGCGSGGGHEGTAPNVGLVHIRVSKYRGRTVTPPVRKPGIVLTDTVGDSYNLRARTAGKVTLLFFGYTHCPDQCPLTMSDTAAAMRHLTAAEQAKIRVVFVTVDPTRDAGPVLRRWLDRFNPAFVGLTGTLRAVQAAANASDIPVGNPVKQPDGSYTLDHGTEMLAFSPDNLAHLAFFPSTSPADLAHDLTLLVKGDQP
jgi:protein SCO1